MNSLSVIIPARNEEQLIEATTHSVIQALGSADISFEILIVDDSSEDHTGFLIREISKSHPVVRCLRNPGQPGLGSAVKWGLEWAQARYVSIVMADGCDDPFDLVAFHQMAVARDLDCVFGSRFLDPTKVRGYPVLRRPFTRLGNLAASKLSGVEYDDFTNAFKLYRRDLIAQLGPFESDGYAFSLELALKAILSGATYEVVANSWSGLSKGSSKFSLARHAYGYSKVLMSCIAQHRSGNLPKVENALASADGES